MKTRLPLSLRAALLSCLLAVTSYTVHSAVPAMDGVSLNTLNSIASFDLLQAETISTWDQLKISIADQSESCILGDDLLIDAATGQIEIPIGSSLNLDGGGFFITGGNSLGDKQTTVKNAGDSILSQITFKENGTQTSVTLPGQKAEANSYGGAIHNTGKLTIKNNSLFTENIVTSTGTASVAKYSSIIDVTANAHGGAIYNANTTESQNISNTSFVRNTALAITIGTDLVPEKAYNAYGLSPVLKANAYGGAVYNAGSMEFKETDFDGNSAKAQSNYIYSLAQGGAIYNAETSGLTKITGGEFTNNFASSHVDTYELENSPVDRVEESYRPHAQGGAIYQAGGVLDISGATRFEGNYVTASSEYAHSNGGAIYNLGEASLKNVFFVGNFAESTCPSQSYVSAGAIFNGKKSTMVIEDSVFEGNYATTSGSSIVDTGAVLNAGGNVTISGSSLNSNYAAATSDKGTISANSGAVRNLPGSNGMGILIVTDTSFTGNYAAVNENNLSSSAYAGALSNTGGTVIISQQSSFEGNYAAAGQLAFGGAINNSTAGTMSITEGRFSKNYAAASKKNSSSISQGGAIYNIGTTISFLSTDFTQNYTSASALALGGAIYHAGQAFEIDGGTFTGNYAAAASAAGGAIYCSISFISTPPPVTISLAAFENNYALGGISATGGAIHYSGDVSSKATSRMDILNTKFIGNHATAGATVDGGAIYHFKGTLSLTQVTFTGNYVSSPLGSPSTAMLHGGAVYNKDFLTIINSTFENNYTMAGNESLGGAIYGNGQNINIIARDMDTVFRGNRQGVTMVDDNGKPLDGQSNAIYVRQGAINLHTNEKGSVIFEDSIAAQGLGCLNINPDNVTGYPVNGTVYFKDGVKIENFEVHLKHGTMSMGDDTFIKGNVYAQTDTTFLIGGFTKIDGNYAIMKGGEAPHTIYVDMDDNMITHYSEEKPVWDFNNGQSSLKNAAGEKLDFILDITDIKNFPEHFRPYIFSHFGQTEELMENVRNSTNVTLIDGDGWTYRIPEIYTEGNRTLDYFDFLSGQYGEFDPFDPANPDWVAPTGAGSAQVETLWTTARSLWSFADGTRAQNKARLNRNSNTAVWISGLGNYYTQENQAHIQGYSYRSWGTSVGGEYSLSSEWACGAAIGELWGKHNMNNSMGSIDKNALLALLYINRDIKLDKTNTLSLNLQGGYENSRNKGDVRINSLINDTLYGKWTDNAWMLDLRATWIRPVNDRTWLDTYAGFQYTYAEQGGCNITSDEYKFRLDDGNMYDFRSTIGTGIRHAREINKHATLSYVRVGIIQDLFRDAPHIEVSGQKRAWTAVGSKPGRTALNFNVGSSIQIIDNWSLGVDYMLEAANKSLMQTGRVSVMCEF